MNSEIFTHHEPCPRCGSRDNLGVWNDGHKWCFGCHLYIPPETTVQRVEQQVKQQQKQNDIALPIDSVYNVQGEPLKWLKQYGIKDREIYENKLMWSQSKEMLIFPFYGEENELLFWQGRFFPSRKPKTITYGYPDSCVAFVGDGGGDCVVCVEDAVSAIKVGRYVTTTPLFGSNLSVKKARRLSRMFKKLVIWLDFDKTSEAMKMAQRYKLLFDEVEVIPTELDPKACSDDLIKEKLNAK